MDGKRLIEKIRLLNILSFGERVIEKYRNKPERNLIDRPHLKGEVVELLPLNVIIGQNASGKSNLVDVIKLLRSLPQDKGLANFISRNGGISEWMWKGKNSLKSAMIETEFKWLDATILYKISLAEKYQRVSIENEEFYNANRVEQFERKDIFGLTDESESLLADSGLNIKLSKAEFIFFRTVLFRLRIYTDLQTTRNSEIRKPQIPDAPNDFLEEDGNNLALVLNDLEHRGETKDKIVENLKKFNPRIKDYSIRILGGTVQLFIREEGLEKPISAMRLSDGTLRYLCLLAILCHPEPPPLICIEEPETGLHPDILPTIAELMKEARHRTQLIITTHSDILVSAFSDMPEAVLVCEKNEDGTHFKRLEKDKLKEWLDEYSLGDLWLKGEIGGTRW